MKIRDGCIHLSITRDVMMMTSYYIALTVKTDILYIAASWSTNIKDMPFNYKVFDNAFRQVKKQKLYIYNKKESNKTTYRDRLSMFRKKWQAYLRDEMAIQRKLHEDR